MTDKMNILLLIVCLCLINTILGYMFHYFDKRYSILNVRVTELEDKLNRK